MMMFPKVILMAPLIFFVQALNRPNRPPPIRIPPPGGSPPGSPPGVEHNPFAPPYHCPRPPTTTRPQYGPQWGGARWSQWGGARWF